MKNYKFLIVGAIVLFAFWSCSDWDNYDSPDAGIEGSIIDNGTGENLEVKSPGGGTIRLLQQDSKYENPAPIDVSIMADGNYRHTMMFAGTYEVFPRDGAFQYLGEPETIQAAPGEIVQQDFEVIPYFRISADVSDTTIRYTITKPEETTEEIEEIIFMVNNYPVVNESVSSNATGHFINLWREDFSEEPQEDLIGNERSFTIDWELTNLPRGEEYFFRVGVRSSAIAKYNYSPVISGVVP